MITATIMHSGIGECCFAMSVPLLWDPYHSTSETLHQDLPHPTLASVSGPGRIGLFALFLVQSSDGIGFGFRFRIVGNVWQHIPTPTACNHS
jgi:hypothetical protein